MRFLALSMVLKAQLVRPSRGHPVREVGWGGQLRWVRSFHPDFRSLRQGRARNSGRRD